MLSEFGIKYVMQNIFDFFDSIFFLVCVRNDIYFKYERNFMLICIYKYINKQNITL